MDKRVMIGIGVTTTISAAWIWYRLSERQKLAQRLAESSSVRAAMEYIVRQPAIPPSDAWLLNPAGFEEKAAEEITFFNAISTDTAYLTILSSLPTAPKTLTEQAAPVVKEFLEWIPGYTWALGERL